MYISQEQQSGGLRENNSEVDSALKEGIQLVAGVSKSKESLDGVVSQYYHRPFIEGVII